MNRRVVYGLLLAAFSAPLSALTFVTEEHPPSNFLAYDGKTITGASTETLREMARRLDLPADFSLYPWRVAYRQALTDATTCVFATSRTEAREKRFKWVGPLAEIDWVVYGLADTTISAKRLEDLRPYVIGGYQSDAKSQYMKEKGFQVDFANAEQQSLQKLASRRVDLWLATSRSGPWLARKLGIPIQPVFTLGQIRLYAACNPAVPDELIRRMNATLREMQQDGSWARINAPYE